MSTEKIADKVRTAMVEAWDDATGYESLPEVVAAHLEPAIREAKREAWESGVNTGIGYKTAMDFMGAAAPPPTNPYGTKEEA